MCQEHSQKKSAAAALPAQPEMGFGLTAASRVRSDLKGFSRPVSDIEADRGVRPCRRGRAANPELLERTDRNGR